MCGRGLPQGNVPLRSEGMAPEEAAREALPQVQHLLLQYEQLLPCLRDAFASAPCSQAPVDRIRRHLAAVERRLEGIAATELQQRSMREVSVNCNVSMGGSWETKRVVLTVEGFTLVDRNGQEGTELTPWSEVSSPGPEPSEPSMVETPTGPLRRITHWWRGSGEAGDGARSNLYQAEMQLPNQRITLQFGAAGPPELMQRLWQASQGNRDATGPGGKVQPLLDLLAKCLQGETHGLEIMTIYQEPLPLPGLNFCQVRQQLSRNGSSNPIQRMHEATKAERVVSWDWNQDVLPPGHIKFFEFKQILPGGLGPSETRVSAVYHLEPDDPDQVILHKATKPWDVPLKDDFLVYHKHIFEKAPDGSVSLQIELGLSWVGSPLKLGPFKATIRNNTLAETLGSGQALSNCLQAA